MGSSPEPAVPAYRIQDASEAPAGPWRRPESFCIEPLGETPGTPPFAQRDVMEYPREDALLCLDVGRPDHLGPFLGFLSHQLSEFGRCHWHGLAAELGQTGSQLRVGQHRVHRLI